MPKTYKISAENANEIKNPEKDKKLINVFMQYKFRGEGYNNKTISENWIHHLQW